MVDSLVLTLLLMITHLSVLISTAIHRLNIERRLMATVWCRYGIVGGPPSWVSLLMHWRLIELEPLLTVLIWRIIAVVEF